MIFSTFYTYTKLNCHISSTIASTIHAWIFRNSCDTTKHSGDKLKYRSTEGKNHGNISTWGYRTPWKQIHVTPHIPAGFRSLQACQVRFPLGAVCDLVSCRLYSLPSLQCRGTQYILSATTHTLPSGSFKDIHGMHWRHTLQSLRYIQFKFDINARIKYDICKSFQMCHHCWLLCVCQIAHILGEREVTRTENQEEATTTASCCPCLCRLVNINLSDATCVQHEITILQSCTT